MNLMPSHSLLAVLTGLIALLAFNSPARAAAGAPRVFRAGAATSNVTPPLGSTMSGSMTEKIATHIHDELHARCLVLDDGKTKLAIAVVDNCMIPREVFDAAKQRASKATGIPVSHMLMSATHTHTGPTAAFLGVSQPDPNYLEFLTQRIADGITRAHHLLEPARIGWGRGREPSQVFNRLWLVRNGAPNPFGGRDQAQMNPLNAGSDRIEPVGPIDPEVCVVSVQSLSGRPISLLANYSLHYVGGTRAGDASADYFGMFAERIKELMNADHQDPAFVAIMSNGTSGDINNVNSAVPRTSKKPYEQMRFVAHLVADEAMRVHRGIAYQEWVDLAVAQKEIALGVRKPTPADLQRAREILANAPKAIARPITPSSTSGVAEFYARETLVLDEYPATKPVLLQVLKIGDLAIAAAPCEVFVELGLELKKRSPFGTTFTISLANGYNGYLPTVRHHALGGYSTWRAQSSYLEVEAAPKIVSTLVDLFAELHSR